MLGGEDFEIFDLGTREIGTYLLNYSRKIMFKAKIHSKYELSIASSSFMSKLNESFALKMQDKKFQKIVLQDHSDYQVDESEDDILNSAFGDRYIQWMKELEKRGTFHGDKLEIYRGIATDSADQINLKNIGLFWTWDKSKAKNYSDKNTRLPIVIITAKIGINEIDLAETLRKAVWAGYTLEESEREITIKPKSRIEIIKPFKKWAYS